MKDANKWKYSYYYCFGSSAYVGIIETNPKKTQFSKNRQNAAKNEIICAHK